ncbi:Uncharacterized protein (Fragment) [Durusdinium trenchii]|uniref:Chitin synthase n=1 Tax=Durusdinium trenchii TaxID=1381693 RepID=A0ABP0NG61_9DINO
MPDDLAVGLWEAGVFEEFLVGGMNLKDFWDHCAKADWYKQHPSFHTSPEQRAKLIPFSMYGDDVQAFRNSEAGAISIMAWSSEVTFRNRAMDAEHMKTRFLHEDFLEATPEEERSCLFKVPGARFDRFMHDACHSQLLGTGKVANGSCLTYLCERGAFGDWPSRGIYEAQLTPLLRKAYASFRAWQKDNKLSCAQPRFTVSRLHRLTRQSWPSLSSKAHASKLLTFWLTAVVGALCKRSDATELDRQVHVCMFAYARALQIMDMNGLVLPHDAAEEYYQRVMLHLRAYADLHLQSSTRVGFTSMTNLGLMPFVCFRHPNGAYSMLKYSDIICGSGEHVLMQVFGGCLLALGLIFLSVCTLWTMMAPKWSSNAEKLGQVNFLIRRFQPNTWWFGLFLLTRGPFLSLPTILAPDSSSLQLSMMLMVLMVSLGVQATVQPWQTPWLNLADTISVSALACVLAVSLGCADGECEPAMETLWVVLAVSLLLILGFFVLMAWLGALYSQVAGKDLAFLNLYKTSHPETIVEGLRDLTRKVSQEDQEQLTHAVANLCFYDLQSAHLAIQALQDCWGIEPRFSGRSRISTTVSQEMELEGEAEDTDAKVLKQGPDLGGAMSSSAEEVHESMTSFMVPTLSDQRPNEAGLVQCEL